MTLVDFYSKVLEKLQAYAAGESPAAEDVALVRDKYAVIHAQLLPTGLVSWAVNEPVDDAAAESLALMVAFSCASEFGADRGRFADGAIGLPQPSLAERQLRQLQANDYVSAPAQSEYF
jgi:hypothetical protein